MKKTLLALATSAALATAMLAPTTADARCRGCGVAAGVIGGLAAGAIIGAAASNGGYYYGPGYGYYGGYYGPGPAYYDGGPYCYWTRQRVWDGYGYRYSRVQVCD